MSVGRSFSSLGRYTIQGNLIPGLYLALLLLVLLAVDPVVNVARDMPVIAGVAALIFGFVLGRVVQALGSRLDAVDLDRFAFAAPGTIRSSWCGRGIESEFDRTVDHLNRVSARHVRVPEASSIDQWVTDNQFAHEFLSRCERTFDLRRAAIDWSTLMFMVLSYLDTHDVGRARRFQAIHSFYRSMWAASFVSLFASVAVLANSLTGYVSELGLASIGVSRSASIVLTSTGMIAVMGWRKSKFEQLFVRYLIIDFYQHTTT